jgi:transcriptional regulator NrdR family protein
MPTCPFCIEDVKATILSGEYIKHSNVYRRYSKCHKCGKKFSTFELSKDEFETYKKCLAFIKSVKHKLDGVLLNDDVRKMLEQVKD